MAPRFCARLFCTAWATVLLLNEVWSCMTAFLRQSPLGPLNRVFPMRHQQHPLTGKASQNLRLLQMVGPPQVVVATRAQHMQVVFTEDQYLKSYAADLERINALLPSNVSWIDTHCHLESIVHRTWRGGANPPVSNSEPQWTLTDLVELWPQKLEGCICNCVFRSPYTHKRPCLSEWSWLERNIHCFNEGSRLWFTVGIHPHDAHSWNGDAETFMREYAMHPRCVGIGECGGDFFRNRPRLEKMQRRPFELQASLAVEMGKPLVFHARKAEKLCLDVLENIMPHDHPIHIHCFSGSVKHARRLFESRPLLKLGFTGAVTFHGDRGRQLADVVRAIPLERILLETDGPYMCPEPFRGHTAHPGHVHLVAERIAGLKGRSLCDVLAQTRANCREVYGI